MRADDITLISEVLGLVGIWFSSTHGGARFNQIARMGSSRDRDPRENSDGVFEGSSSAQKRNELLTAIKGEVSFVASLCPCAIVDYTFSGTT